MLPKSLTESWLNRFGPLNLYSKIFWCSWDIHSFMIKICLVQKQPLEVFYKKGVLKSFANFTEKKLCSSLFLIQLQALGLQLYQKETWAHVFSCESCEICFEEHLPTAGSISRCFSWIRDGKGSAHFFFMIKAHFYIKTNMMWLPFQKKLLFILFMTQALDMKP